MLYLTLLLAAPPAFIDRTADLGLTLDTGPVCWLDFDRDGRPDLCGGTGLWLNRGAEGFAKLADVGPVVAADFDNDGFSDLFAYGARRLYRNDQGRGLTEVALPELPPTVCLGACWADLDGDGFVDLYLGGYEDWDNQITYPDLVLRNEGGTGFRLEATIDGFRARGVTACDFDEDGDADIYVSNYRLQPNLLWLNDGAGNLAESAAEYGVVATSEGFAGGHSIGACWGDFDGDGRFDLFAGNFAHVDNRGDQPKSRFYRNLGPGGEWRFEDRGTGGVHYQESYATPAAGDYDRDGDLDLLFTTVYGTASFGRPNHPVLYRNDGDFMFVDVTAEAGLAGLPPTYQAAWADVDQDGDLDLACGGRLFVNQRDGGNWLAVRLEGDGTRVNRDAIGAQVRVLLAERVVARQVEAGTGEGNQNDLALHFGLGDQAGPYRLEIRWPGVAEPTILDGVEGGRRHELRFGG